MINRTQKKDENDFKKMICFKKFCDLRVSHLPFPNKVKHQNWSSVLIWNNCQYFWWYRSYIVNDLMILKILHFLSEFGKEKCFSLKDSSSTDVLSKISTAAKWISYTFSIYLSAKIMCFSIKHYLFTLLSY